MIFWLYARFLAQVEKALPAARLIVRRSLPPPLLSFQRKGRERRWIPDRVEDDREGKSACGVIFAGFRPRTTRSFCFGKRTQNHGRRGVALRGPLPRSRMLGGRGCECKRRRQRPNTETEYKDTGSRIKSGMTEGGAERGSREDDKKGGQGIQSARKTLYSSGPLALRSETHTRSLPLGENMGKLLKWPLRVICSSSVPLSCTR